MKTIFFDLDNTLYDNTKYCLGAFLDISKYLATKYNLDEEKTYQLLTKLWKEKTSMYSFLFDDLLNSLNLKEKIKNIIKIFNNHKIMNEQLYPDALPILKKLKQDGYKLGIITDGDVERQKRKIQNLELHRYVDVIIYTKDIEPKPSIRPFIVALNMIESNAVDAIYVADNPYLDFEGSKKAGIQTVRVIRGEFKQIPNNNNIDFIIKNLNELYHIIK